MEITLEDIEQWRREFAAEDTVKKFRYTSRKIICRLGDYGNGFTLLSCGHITGLSCGHYTGNYSTHCDLCMYGVPTLTKAVLKAIADTTDDDCILHQSTNMRATPADMKRFKRAWERKVKKMLDKAPEGTT